MSDEEITIDETGVTIFGNALGLTPTIGDFETLIKRETVRNLPPLNGRQLKILDSHGLSWLADLQFGTVLWLHVLLAHRRHKPHDDHDPNGVFEGKVRIGQYTVQRPFSFETAEIVRKVRIPCIGIDFVPDEKRICAVLLAFTKNEKASDTARN